MLSFVLKLLFVLLLGRLIGGLIRLAVGSRNKRPTAPRATPAPKKPQAHLGEDIVDAEFEDVPKGKS